MIVTVTERTPEALKSALVASKVNGRRAELIHSRDGVMTICRGFHLSSGYLSLIATDGSYLLVQEGDTIQYDDGS